MGFRDKNGIRRHYMDNVRLNSLYYAFGEFVSDLTIEERKKAQGAINQINTLIHFRINENNKGHGKEGL